MSKVNLKTENSKKYITVYASQACNVPFYTEPHVGRQIKMFD